MSDARRQALIIANSDYSDSKLSKLSAPEVDAELLKAVLEDTTIGYFDEVKIVPNGNSQQVREEIERFFSGKKRDDTLLLYFSGHGVLDPNGRLYLAAANTNTQRLRSTGVSAQFISESMDASRSKRQILILDCCHSGAFARNSKAAIDRTVGTGPAFKGDGTGRVILTATDSTQHAWEGDNLIKGDGGSRFTHFLIEGLQTGKADRLKKGHITIDDLYEYVYEQVKTNSPEAKPQTPQRWGYSRVGDLLIAKNPHIYPQAKKPPPRRIGGVVTREDLRQVLDDLFEVEQIEDIAFDLGLDERNLGSTKSAKIRALLRQLDQQARLTDLIDWLHRNIPELFKEVFGERETVQLELRYFTSAPQREIPPSDFGGSQSELSSAGGLKKTANPSSPPSSKSTGGLQKRRDPGKTQTTGGLKKRSSSTMNAQSTSTRTTGFSWRAIPLWGWGVAVLGLIVLIFAFNSLGGSRTPDDGLTPTQPVTETTDSEQLASEKDASASSDDDSNTDFVPAAVDGIEWVEIPAGPFMMGAAEGDVGADDDEFPLHEVTLDAYWIAKTEVTNAQYKQFVDATGHRTPSCVWENGSIPNGLENHPVVCVSWDDAVAYTEWLSAETGMNIALPSEAEWEKAARGEAQPLIYPWGNTFEGTFLNYCDSNCGLDWRDPDVDDGFELRAPVGSFPDGASPYGVLDMSGNVWEWTSTIYDQDAFPYPYDGADGREDLTDGDALRVLRGGSFYDNPENVRASYRYGYVTYYRLDSGGFRVVVRPPSQS